MDWNALKRDVKPVYVKLCGRGREEFLPFLDSDLKVRAVISSTNAIESLNARYRRPVGARGTSRAIRRRGSACILSLVASTPSVVATPKNDALEARAQGARHHPPRPLAGRGNRLTNTAVSTASQINPVVFSRNSCCRLC